MEETDAKKDYYNELLHPDRKGLTDEEQHKVASDATFISAHIDKIDEIYQESLRATRERGKTIDEHKMIEIVVNGVKRDYYNELLHPDSEGLTDEELYKVLSDATFISAHIDEIDKKFQDLHLAAEIEGKPIDERKMIEMVVKEVKGKQEPTRDDSAEMKIAENAEESIRNIANTRTAENINETSRQISSEIKEIEKPMEKDDRDSQEN